MEEKYLLQDNPNKSQWEVVKAKSETIVAILPYEIGKPFGENSHSQTFSRISRFMNDANK